MKEFKLQFLGTCALDYSSKLQNEFKDKFDYDCRRSASAIFNERYLIDCGYHTLDSLKIAKADISKITDIFITHLHPDHFIENNISEIAKASTNGVKVWVSQGATVPQIDKVTYVFMEKGKTYAVEGALKVTGLMANHAKDTFPQHLLFQCNEEKMYYATDGSWIRNDTYEYLKDAKIDLLILDCTIGNIIGDDHIGGHNTLPMVKLLIPSLKTNCAITDKTIIYLTHIAPSFHKSHFEIESEVEKLNMHVAYDGLKI